MGVGYVFQIGVRMECTNAQVKYEHTNENNEIFVPDITNLTTFRQ